jgi:hypothetical protein
LMQNGMLPMIIYKDNKVTYSNAIKKSSNSWKNKTYYKVMLEQYKKTLEEFYNQ